MESKKMGILIGVLALCGLIITMLVTSNNKTYKVSFNSNGGSNVETQLVKAGKKVTKPSVPKKVGYKFVSWQKDDVDFDFDTVIKEDIVLKAKWEEEVVVINVSDVTLSKTTLYLKVGDAYTLSANVIPSDATNKNLTWSSSNEEVATVDSNGRVVAVKVGSATIVVTVDGKSHACTVKVTKKITYSIEWVKVENSAVGQYTLFIKDQDGNHVSGEVNITSITGTVKTVTIPVDCIMYIKSAIADVKINKV